MHLTEYRKAIPYLTIAKVEVDKREIIIETILTVGATLGLSDKRLDRVRGALEQEENLTTRSGYRILQEIEREHTISSEPMHVPKVEGRRKEDIQEPGEEYKGVNEEQLMNHLSHGWIFVTRLDSGKYLVKREPGAREPRQ
ncbi:MAG: hypothetical protein ACETVR_02995 [Candidatus Bathyarchaeia archaeon]